MNVTRRQVLVGSAALAAATVARSSAAAVREPFVAAGEPVDSIVFHLWELPFAPTGPVYVHEVLPWDGRAYPLILSSYEWQHSVGPGKALYAGWNDTQWANFRREVPSRFWADHSTDDYPNVHAYVRQQRYGESPSVMRDRMERNRVASRNPDRLRAQPFAWVQ